MINKQKAKFDLPVVEVSKPPPFIKLLTKCKSNGDFESALEKIKEYWYSKGLADMAKMYEKVLSNAD